MSEEGAWGYVCPGCRGTDKDGRPIDKVRPVQNGSKETAESLATIHRAKTGHSPEVTEV